MSNAVRKYLERHAERSAALGFELKQHYGRSVVIPAYGEGHGLDQAIASVPVLDGEPTLAVVVINEHEDSSISIKATNQATWTRLKACYDSQCSLGRDAVLCQGPFGDLAILRLSLPRGQGVGLARKHGTDFAFGAWAAGKLRSPWIHCTDADVLLPGDYFDPPQAAGAAALHPFRHEAADAAMASHARSYDLWLRLHVLGLHWAGSPYGFHAIGSTIAVNAPSYAAVRGFPRRNAAEDFYLLNKLAKQGPIVTAPSAPLRIAARISDRVPFGTGRAMGRMQRQGPGASPCFYHPKVYIYLKHLLEIMERGIETAVFDPVPMYEALRRRNLEAAPMQTAMEALGLHTAVARRLSSSSNKHRRRRAVHGWFDGFRTMKLIHHLRDNGIASVDQADAVAAGGFLLDQYAERVRDDLQVVSSHLSVGPGRQGTAARG